MEVVLLDGLVIIATAKNAHSDLFWALQGGNGQFAIVTRFWVRAVVEPSKAEVGRVLAIHARPLSRISLMGFAIICRYYWITPKDVPKARENVVDFFNSNQDPVRALPSHQFAPLFG